MSGVRVPAEIETYVRILGEDAAVKLMLDLGGAALSLAEKPGADSLVVQAVGHDKAVALWVEFGIRIDRVPVSNKWIARVLRARGEGVNAIARRLRVTDKAVRDWLKTDRTAQERLRLERKAAQACQIDLEDWLTSARRTEVRRK